ncbi:hypothetical protein DICPUDRAFT_50965 [Dictyostelium purpureum]|uniref:Uncharacterized protein n=1 Tax=Dictyostelium purpureum TaxID=5786 RepID=F1A184_DICPU|nr:uncharacterized protein DICPUDRAFT_50965 [Dictyostelium purpureum]EGC30046.1 hypothetical protein DICPUDRAFT_50965 [Dictyostelium purpureum]|eukprot:XP_003293433.1 hypothetical protein DICPUDRAFT_50965 [Dictyostelium purpureum]
MSSTTTEIPYHFLKYIRIQYDWQLAYKQDSDNFWVSYQKDIRSTTHGSVHSSKKSDNSFSFESDQGFKLTPNSNDKNNIKVEIDNFECDIYSPEKTLKVLGGKKRITTMGVSNLGELGVFGSTDGTLEVFETIDGQIRRKLDGHVGDVDLALFFPSGKVILSGASDGRLKIWDAIEGTCAATLIGHIGGITSASLVDRGRNLVSGSRDGTSKLWDVASSSVIHNLTKLSRPINDCFVASSLLESTTSSTSTSKNVDERESGTEGKTVILAAEEGFLQAIDLRSKNMIAQMNVPNENNRSVAFNACFVHKNYIIGGDHNGSLFFWDKRNLNSPFCRLQFTSSPIHHIKANSSQSKVSNSIWTTSGDGSVFLIDLDKNKIITSLSGIDTDVVTSFNIVNNQAFSTSRDSIIRCYNNLSNI